MTSERPKLRDYLARMQPSPEAMIVRETKAAEARATELRRGKAIVAILESGLPLLKKHVEMSPVEICRSKSVGRGRDKRTIQEAVRVLGGWPICNVGTISESSSDVRDSTYTLVLTEESQFGLVDFRSWSRAYTFDANGGSGLYDVKDFEQFDLTFNPRYHRVSEAMVATGINNLLGEAGIEFVIPKLG